MIVVQRGVVDITPEYNRALRPVFCVSEGDKTSRQIVITVMQNGEAFLIPSGSTVYIIGKKSDSNIFTYRCNYSGSDVSFGITEQMSAASGIVLCELQINLSGQVLGSANFVYWTEPTPVDNGTYSESDLNIMLEAIAGAERLDNFYAGIEDMVAQAVEQIQIMPGQVVIDPTLLVNGAAADAAATGNAVRSFLNALITETTPTAAIATCDDAAGGLPLKKLTANIEPTQSGTGDPSPDNVRPISGYTGVTVARTGKNLLTNIVQNTTKNGITMTRNADGTLTFSGTATADAAFYTSTVNGSASSTNTGLINIKAGTYTLSGCPVSGSGSTYVQRFYLFTLDDEYTNVNYPDTGTGNTFVISDECKYRLGIRFGNGTTVSNLTFKPQLEIGDTATTYEPYNSATYAVNFPTKAGTVYGGTLTVNSDGSGTLTIDRAGFDANTKTWAWGGGMYVYTNLSATALLSGYPTVQSSHFPFRAQSGTADGYCSWGGSPNSNGNLVVRSEAVAPSLADWNTYIQNNTVTFVYSLAQPTTYALSAVQVAQMLQGVNNVWMDTAGTLTTEYYASTGLYVEKKVNAQRNMIAGVEDAMIATKNYSVNDLLIVGNTLYKVTAAISSGAALVVGTNVTETTVAEQLLALA